MRVIYFSIFIAVITYGFTVSTRAGASMESFTFPASSYGVFNKPFTEGSLLFTGDIMLGRGVEDLMLMYGTDYPFIQTRTFIQSHDVAIANFEGTIPLTHKQTRSMELRFSMGTSTMATLARSGFDVISLANNHALDYGLMGLENTRLSASKQGITAIGHPTEYSTHSFKTIVVGDTVVGLLMLHTLPNRNATSSIGSHIAELSKLSDVQFVFVHWGDEYQNVHAHEEEKLAHYMIDYGADAVIGHHPHVVQDTELYRNKPIFYSLGNFIFDQYWNTAVQTGYFVQVVLKERFIDFAVIPYDSVANRSQPTLQTGDKKIATVRSILTSPYFTEDNQRTGTFSVQYDTGR